LTLLNNEFVLKQAALFAARLKEATLDPGQQVMLAYELALGRSPRPDERELALDYLKNGSLAGLTHVLFNTSEFLYLR
jgi:Protein of unknown function (DUF1553)